MCKPFSMGRNLLCVYSKKHMEDDPEKKQAKMNSNRKTMVTMQRMLNEGGKIIWVAPSGGRDRPKEASGAAKRLAQPEAPLTCCYLFPPLAALLARTRRTAPGPPTASTPRPSACSSRWA